MLNQDYRGNRTLHDGRVRHRLPQLHHQGVHTGRCGFLRGLRRPLARLLGTTPHFRDLHVDLVPVAPDIHKPRQNIVAHRCFW
jgi:hypothetical protein